MTITASSIVTMPNILSRIAPEVEEAGEKRALDTPRAPFPPEWVIMPVAKVLLVVRRAYITHRLSFKFKSSEFDGRIRLDTLHGGCIQLFLRQFGFNICAINPSIDKRATE